MAEIVEMIALDGEPEGDRAYRMASGRIFRVRAKLRPIAADVPLNGEGAEATPQGYGVELSISKLNDDLSVAKDDTGRFHIMAAEVHTIDIQAFQNPDFDADDYIADCLSKMLDKAETWAGQMERTHGFFTRWMTGQPAALDRTLQAQG